MENEDSTLVGIVMARKTKKKVPRGGQEISSFLQGHTTWKADTIQNIIAVGRFGNLADVVLLFRADLIVPWIHKDRAAAVIVAAHLNLSWVDEDPFLTLQAADMAAGMMHGDEVKIVCAEVQEKRPQMKSPSLKSQEKRPREEEWEPRPEKKWHTEDLQSLLDRLTPEDIDAMSQRGYDPEWVRQVMYLKLFLLEFTMWEEDDIRVFICTEECMAVDELLRLFESPWRQRWAAPWIDEATAFQYAQQYVQLSRAEKKNSGEETAPEERRLQVVPGTKEKVKIEKSHHVVHPEDTTEKQIEKSHHVVHPEDTM